MHDHEAFEPTNAAELATEKVDSLGVPDVSKIKNRRAYQSKNFCRCKETRGGIHKRGISVTKSSTGISDTYLYDFRA